MPQMGPLNLPRIPYKPRSGPGSYLCARGDLNRARPTLVMPELSSLSVKYAPVDSRLIQLERGSCHTLWHRLDLDFVFD